MWNSGAGAASYYGHQPPQPSSLPPAPSNSNSSGNPSGQKHDIFVGNLAFSTTEEQLYAAFSELGRIIKIRMVSDNETGKPRGFAFIEFEDPQAALSAIRNMNEYEINGRKIRVNFSNSSHLETLANQLGMDLSHVAGPNKNKDRHEEGKSSHLAGGGAAGERGAGSRAVATALRGMNKGELYDVVAKLKEIADANPDEARKILTQHPQLPEAILYCMKELDMINTPVGTGSGMGGVGAPAVVPAPDLAAPPPPAPPATAPPPVAVRDPRALPPPPTTAPPPSAGMPSDPRARPADPRAARDPRAAAAAGGAPNFPPPPMMQPPPGVPPPPLHAGPPPPAAGVAAGLDPVLAQQVMALTPAQIAQLPPDKQANILMLRQRIEASVRR